MGATLFQKPSEVKEKWYILDATNKILGRLATRIACILRGKTESTFTPHVMQKNYVIVINSDKIKISGNKFKNKVYRYHTSYPKGFREILYFNKIKKHPTFPLRNAVYGMLPKNKSRKGIIGKLKIYQGEDHLHKNQKLIPISL